MDSMGQYYRAEPDSLDIERIRDETPGVRHRLHLNNAGAALMPQRVVAAITRYLEKEMRIGGYEATIEESAPLEAVYDDIATLIGAQAGEIAIVGNATLAWDQAFYGLDLKPGDRILTAQAEYAANYLAFLQRARRDGLSIDVVPSDERGALDTEALEAMIDERVGLIAVTWIPTNGGLVNPAAKIGEIANRHEIPYLLDACQAVGQMPIDVRSLGCDFLSATGRKFLRGPRGTGFLYVRQELIETLEPAMIDLFSAEWVERDRYRLRRDAKRFETWENPYALRLGLGEAVRYACSLGLPAIQKRAWALADQLRDALEGIPRITLHDAGWERCAIVGFSLDGADPDAVEAALREQGINISVSSPLGTRLDAEARDLPTLLRASPHYYNTEDEIVRFTQAIAALAGAL